MVCVGWMPRLITGRIRRYTTGEPVALRWVLFAGILPELAAQGDATGTLMIDEILLKTHLAASSMGLKKGGGRLIGRSKGGLNS